MGRGGGEDSSSTGLQQWRLVPGPYLGEISALSLLPLPSRLSPLPLLLAGTGSELLVYDISCGRLIGSFRVFQGVRVHGIALRSPDPGHRRDSLPVVEFLIAVFGERRVKLFEMQVDDGLRVGLEMVCRLPGFDHWVLDACFLKEVDHLAIGLSDNSVAMWDICRSNLVVRVKSPDRCLLYSMRMWGDNIEALRVASGTIYNEIIVWKLCLKELPAVPTVLMEESSNRSSSTGESMKLHTGQYTSVHLGRLSGHEGSIFRITWSSDGSTLISASDDRSARIWQISEQGLDTGNVQDGADHVSVNLNLFGHDARVWDCCLSDSIVITAGEDCTCRVWGADGGKLLTIKEHIGRGIWRCLYEPNSSLLITAGFDSAIKGHHLHQSFKETSKHHQVLSDLQDQTEIFTLCAPKVSKEHGLMDSKSEYIRCMRWARENILYVATNNGFLYRVELSKPGDVRWTKLAQISEEAPIVCMDLIVTKGLEFSLDEDDIIAVGDGKGNASAVRFISKPFPKLAACFTWSAEKERQLLGIYWCKSLGCSHLFTADPKGVLKLWKISDALRSDLNNSCTGKVFLIAVFTSYFRTRIMCLDASIQLEVLVCGDQRGNLTVFPLSEDLIIGSSGETVENIASINWFKGGHGISCVTSALIAIGELSQVEIRTTGGDGCICYFKYDRDLKCLEFIGMKQVKELSIVQSVASSSTSLEVLAESNYAIGFTSTDFIIWDVRNEMKTLQIPCGGWRRSFAYHLGSLPEYESCFAYVKDHRIHIYRCWAPIREGKQFPQVFHMQYHGREIHSLCFIPSGVSDACHKLLIATGCEDGTVRLTRYTPFDIGSWCTSKLLGEHVGGSAVRSTCFTSRIYTSGPSQAHMQEGIAYNDLPWNREDPHLLISVGAKQVLTCWILRHTIPQDEASGLNEAIESAHIVSPSTNEISKISFQWLSTHMPAKFSSAHHRVEKVEVTKEGHASTVNYPESPYCLKECRREKLKSILMDKNENDWRYLAVTAFMVKHTESRLTVSFVVVACSDATLILRALVLPFRRWYDVALMVPQTSPVLALQHVVLPHSAFSEDSVLIGNAYIIISGSTDGSITFWDLTETVDNFMQLIVKLQSELLVDNQRRPQTGRGSQGGRWWKSVTSQPSGERTLDALVSHEDGENINSSTTGKNAFGASSLSKSDSANGQKSYPKSMSSTTSLSPGCHTDSLPPDIVEIQPLYVVGSVHQSGVNCLHVAKLKDCFDSKSEGAYCVVSGGDDQALHSLGFSLELQMRKSESSLLSQPGSIKKCSCHRLKNNLKVLFQDRIASAHNSAVKGIWADGNWVFSTGLDQRVRCWQIDHGGKLTEHANLVISVPEPEALDAIVSGSARNRYQIAVAGRGMQMVEFSAPCDED